MGRHNAAIPALSFNYNMGVAATFEASVPSRGVVVACTTITFAFSVTASQMWIPEIGLVSGAFETAIFAHDQGVLGRRTRRGARLIRVEVSEEASKQKADTIAIAPREARIEITLADGVGAERAFAERPLAQPVSCGRHDGVDRVVRCSALGLTPPRADL